MKAQPHLSWNPSFVACRCRIIVISKHPKQNKTTFTVQYRNSEMQSTLTTPIVTQRRMSRRLAQRYNSAGSQLTPHGIAPPSTPVEEPKDYIKVNTKSRAEIQKSGGGYPAGGKGGYPGGNGGYSAAGIRRGPRKTRSKSNNAIHNSLLKTKGARK